MPDTSPPVAGEETTTSVATSSATTPPEPSPRVVASGPRGWISSLIASPKLTPAAVTFGVAILAGPFGVDYFLGDYLIRYLDIREAELLSASEVKRIEGVIEEHAAADGHARLQIRVALAEKRVERLEAGSMKMQEAQYRTGVAIAALCASMNVDCTPVRP